MRFEASLTVDPNAVMRDISERMDVRVLEYAPGDLETVLGNVDFSDLAVTLQAASEGVEAVTLRYGVSAIGSVPTLSATGRLSIDTLEAIQVTAAP